MRNDQSPRSLDEIVDNFCNRLQVREEQHYKSAFSKSEGLGAAEQLKALSSILNFSEMSRRHSDFAVLRNALGSNFDNIAQFNKSSILSSIKTKYSDATVSQFSDSGGLLVGDFTVELIGQTQEYYGNTALRSELARVFPVQNVNAQKLAVDIWAAPGGQIPQYLYGTQPAEIVPLSNRQYEFSTIPYRAILRFNETDMTYLRKLGSPDFSVRGFIQRLVMNANKLVQNMQVTEDLLRATLFNNQIVYEPTGSAPTVISYNIPSWNMVTLTGGNVFGTYTQATGVVTTGSNADPIGTLINQMTNYQPWTPKWAELQKCEMIMSPPTLAAILNNPAVKEAMVIVQSPVGNSVDPRGNYNVETLLKTRFPGLDITVTIDRSTWLQADSSVMWSEDTDQQWSWATNYTNQQYRFPPGVIMFKISPREVTGMDLGYLAMGPSIQTSGWQTAAAGPFMALEDCTQPGTRGGPANPFLQLVIGANMMLAVTHPECVMYMKVLTIA